MLSHNHISNLSDLQPLSKLANLAYLSLVDNPVTNQEYYRSWVIWQNPNIRVLDYQKVKDSERTRANELFGPSHDQPTDLAAQILSSAKVRTFNVKSEHLGPASRKQISEKDKESLRQELKSATSLAEISRIEQALKSGYF